MSPKINTIDGVLTSLQEKNFHPLYLFYGLEDFLIDEAVTTLIENAVSPASQSFNLDVVYGGEVDVQDVVALASAFPMMSDHRVVIVRDAEKLATSEASRELLLRYLEKPVQSTILVFVASKADMRLRVFKAFQDGGVSAEFRPLYDNQIPEWIRRRMNRLKRAITPEASQLLQAHVGTSLREILNEIDKLLVYVGEKRTIELEDVAAVVGVSRSFNAYELQKALSYGDAVRAMEILQHLLDAGDSPIGIIVTLTRFFQKVWVIPALRRKAHSDYELASALQVSPYYVREYVAAADRFLPGQVKSAFQALLEADTRLKSTQEDPRIVMTTLLYQLLKPLKEAAA